jgi:hypothetical protein
MLAASEDFSSRLSISIAGISIPWLFRDRKCGVSLCIRDPFALLMVLLK